ncbi:ATP-dependent RNA helicase DeaD [Weissella uvarum]|uniref:DEAD/DEAH box helicase n=1 Tax=Weissella uvarum TaxID=1479233 RepID=UPI001EF7FA86|nr:DEAD/DEAH box helicase [Weissella uvarum]MBM7617659.1 ATP-dependent RNA helicase DeaD [Weissella uvarum]
MKFAELGLSDDLLTAITKQGYEEATPIQEKTIPLILDGKDVIGQAQTGTGKTAAFGLPILQMLDENVMKPQALVVSPTRELAIQTQDEIFKLGRDKHVKVQAVFGGADIRRQINGLKHGAQVVVGTPGRLLDHINRGTVDLSNVKTLVLDEADEMLNMGFLDDIESILKAVPDKRQTLLFSATMPPAIKRIGVQFMKDPVHVQIEAKELTTDLVDQYYVKVRENEKFDTLTRILDVQNPELAIMFGRTKRRVDELTRGLELRGYNAAGIHGDLTQQKRSQVLKQFKNGEINILVATDVAARGLDVSGVDYVYNFDIPQDSESYVHRIGRTGRAGHTGTSVTFVTSAEMDYLKDIEKLTKKRMQPLKPATKEEAIAGRLAKVGSKVEKLADEANPALAEEEVNNLVNKYDAKTLAAALLGSVANIDDMDTPYSLSRERPLPRKRYGNGGGGNRRSGNGGGYRGGNRRDNGHGGGNRRSGNGGSDRRGNGGQSRRSRDFVIKNKD